ncbi:twin-arginine translocase subunit TatC [Euzebya tangerina]|uniref:twin-arginine translocase subunit TatC n=1 Tax=Euzebya tangerina TaxID=591198 RepID=UPI000E30EB4B|nr:twin-arginine translocase subunit TatC [Euzebya tangerina]
MTATADPAVPSDGDDYQGEEMTLFEHLAELRSRLIKATLGFGFFFVIGFIFNDIVTEILTDPYCQLPEEVRGGIGTDSSGECQLIFINVLGGFVVRLKGALIVAITFGAPIMFYQLWAFIVPGLKAKEKKYAAPFVILTQVLFLAGAAFSLFIIPRGLEFLLQFAGDDFVPVLDAEAYITFLIRTMLAFGISFEYPLVIAILVLMDIVSHDLLKKYRRHAFFSAFVAAAIITPSQDPFTMCVMALPLAGFYEICIVFAKVIERGRGRRDVAAA